MPGLKKVGFSPYLSHISGRDRTHPDTGFRTQNPVVRKHRVGSSPTSGIEKFLQNAENLAVVRKAPGMSTGHF